MSYNEAKPFPHVVIDGYFAKEELSWLQPHSPAPEKNCNVTQRKEQHGYAKLPEKTEAFVNYLNSGKFIAMLERITEIDGLIPDPWMNGGGFHRIHRGGFLKIHADFNYHAKLKLYRRVNVLIYLNESWHESWGGNLELWDRNMKRCEKQIVPIFNRMVIFNTDDTSFHGHPEPLSCPENITRDSIAMYYYTVDNPNNVRKDVRTKYRERPGEELFNKSFRAAVKRFFNR